MIDIKDNHTRYNAKGARQHMLPRRNALNEISGGDPSQRALGNYAKAAPDITENGPNIFGNKSDGV